MQNDSGFLLVHKPVGPTSFAVVQYLRKITGVKKIGHAGTLDPLASGLLVCAIGREATRNISHVVASDKVYEMEIVFSLSSAGHDLEGPVRIEPAINPPSLGDFRKILKKFEGDIEQVPPARSAKKVAGVRAYQLDRKNISPTLDPHRITIHRIKLLSYRYPYIRLEIHCSSGTYMRSLARDIAKAFDSHAVMSGLVRKRVGKYSLYKSTHVAQITRNNWRTLIF